MLLTKKRSIMACLLAMIALACVVLAGCGDSQEGAQTTVETPETPVASVFTVYNTKDMQDSEILNLFSEHVLEDVKNDERNRTIVVYELGDDVREDAEISWVLSNEEGWSSAESDLDIYVDEDAPDSGNRMVKIMIGWDASYLDKTWIVTIYDTINEEATELGKVEFKVTSADYIKTATAE